MQEVIITRTVIVRKKHKCFKLFVCFFDLIDYIVLLVKRQSIKTKHVYKKKKIEKKSKLEQKSFNFVNILDSARLLLRNKAAVPL